MLHGVRPAAQRALAAEGETVRVYLPYGTEWFGYFMRRLAERPANLAFFARSLLSRGLAMPPAGRARRWARSPCLPNRLRNSTAAPVHRPEPVRVRVSNSAASPGVSTRSCSPRTTRSRPSRT